MIEKVTLQMSENGKIPDRRRRRMRHDEPKALLLYAAAQCAAQTALMIMRKERIAPKRFEIGFSGELSTQELRSESVFTSFHVVYNVECGSEDDQAKVSRAIVLTHEKHCGLVRMLRMIAPVSHEVAVVSTEPAKA